MFYKYIACTLNAEMIPMQSLSRKYLAYAEMTISC